MGAAADLIERNVHETLTYYSFQTSIGRRFEPITRWNVS